MAQKTRRAGYRLAKPTFKNKATGERQKTAKWYIAFVDQHGAERRLPADSSESASHQLGERLARLVGYYKLSGGQIDPTLSAWLNSLPGAIRERLAQWGLLGMACEAARRGLAEHVADWHAAILAGGASQGQADLRRLRAKAILGGIGAMHFGNVTGSRVSAFLSDLRAGTKDKPGVSERTANFYLDALNGFFRWAVKDRRLTENPIAHLKKLKVTDAMHRRALSVEEQRWLIDTTAKAPDRFGMTGEDRAVLYRLALGTGFRASELGALTRGSFDLNGNPPTVTLPPAATKNRKGCVQPITHDLAEALRPALAGKVPTVRAFNVPPRYDTAAMIRDDLAAARAAWMEKAAPEDRADLDGSDFCRPDGDAGRVDFHALRHSFGTNLARANTPVKTAMDLMRHSDVNLTMRLYSHTVTSDRATALEAAAPDLSMPVAETARKTGTDDLPARKSLPSSLPEMGGNRRALVNVGGRTAGIGRESQVLADTGFPAFSQAKSPTRPAGIEPATTGLGNRCSIQLSYERNVPPPTGLIQEAPARGNFIVDTVGRMPIRNRGHSVTRRRRNSCNAGYIVSFRHACVVVGCTVAVAAG